MIHDKKKVGIEIKFYNLDTFRKQVDANCIDLDSEFEDLSYKVASLIFCHFWRSIQQFKASKEQFYIFLSLKDIMNRLYLLLICRKKKLVHSWNPNRKTEAEKFTRF